VLFAALLLVFGLQHWQPERQVLAGVGGRPAFFLEQLFLLAHVILIKKPGQK
jgi:hypothetical protein